MPVLFLFPLPLVVVDCVHGTYTYFPSIRSFYFINPIYQPSLSSSFSSISCDTPRCRSLDVSTCRNNSCLYQVSYGDDSYSVGDYISKTLTFSDDASVDNIAIGCGHNVEGLFVGATGVYKGVTTSQLDELAA
ncbi:hypothetical protein Scep_001846 [Stephania cephalantha]|uniref:Xylanase inhibitor N-terminal domain-containing protein n=1 Tax=Stephania cephalantha TaxID=152367 RepID=A0AAP0L9V4_9MAGN